MANTLFLRLEGPLQSWGERARWSVRDTATEPTKSGIVGLLACALGLNDDASLYNLAHQIRLGVRSDRPGALLVDYHTVVGGVMSAEGKIKRNANTGEPETVVSWRHYLCDASFLVAIQAAPELIAKLGEAVKQPHWPIYLGRKSCPPSRPLFDGEGDYPSLEAALKHWRCRLAQAEQKTIETRAVIECGLGEGVRRRDEIESHSRRTFGPRYTRDLLVEVEVEAEEL